MKRQYVKGGFVLPVSVEFAKVGICKARLVDAKGRLIQSFNSAVIARHAAQALNAQQGDGCGAIQADD